MCEQLRAHIREIHTPQQRIGHYSHDQPVYVTVCSVCVDRYTDEDPGGHIYQVREYARWPCETIEVLNMTFD